MSVNKESSSGKRIRRSPDEARALILRIAAERLGRLGLDGLNISGVAKDAGMSHATVIHHFGSTGAMREALLAQMSRDLLSDVKSALDHNEPPAQILDRLFGMLSQGGHGRLLAWLALDQHRFAADTGAGGLFAEITATIARESGDAEHARQLVFLVAIAAMGRSICGDTVAELIGMTSDEQQAFPAWLADKVQTI